MRALVKCTYNLAIQKFRSLANWIFHGVYDFVSGVVGQAACGMSSDNDLFDSDS